MDYIVFIIFILLATLQIKSYFTYLKVSESYRNYVKSLYDLKEFNFNKESHIIFDNISKFGFILLLKFMALVIPYIILFFYISQFNLNTSLQIIIPTFPYLNLLRR